jgi:hypothetical protein
MRDKLDKLLPGEVEGRGWARSRIIRPQESLVLYQSINSICRPEKHITRDGSFASSCYSNRQAELSAKAEQRNLWTNVMGWVPGISLYVCPLLDGETLHKSLHTINLFIYVRVLYEKLLLCSERRQGSNYSTVLRLLTHAIPA